MRQVTQWIREADVVSALTLTDAVVALRSAFADEGRGTALAMEKTMISFAAGVAGATGVDGGTGGAGHGTLHALGAALEEDQLVGTKTWAHTPGGADPVLLLFDAADGSLIAVMEAFALGQLRTAGTAALATDRLARSDVTSLGVVGTGKQALPQVAAICAVRPIQEVRVFSRDPEKRKQFASTVESELAVSCQPTESVAEAVSGAGVVTLVTRATEPVLTEPMVEPGMHINAVGAIDLKRREFEPALLGRCSVVVSDSIPQVKSLSSEFREFYASEHREWSAVRPLGEVVAAPGAGRTSPTDVTLFKGMGSGLEDLALARAVLGRMEGRRPSGEVIQVPRAGRARPVLK
ncbi:MAG TPA: ornithine cyclodeaminase family protein [Acidimicrobiales bacterium]|nr:ornithine cyclodeaminase family protein [Acidimicrobiales bacterium]